MQLYRAGWSTAMRDLMSLILSAGIGAVLWAVVFFVWNIVRAPLLIHKESLANIARIERERDEFKRQFDLEGRQQIQIQEKDKRISRLERERDDARKQLVPKFDVRISPKYVHDGGILFRI